MESFLYSIGSAVIGLGLLMFFYYRRELRFHAGMARWVPALLRAPGRVGASHLSRRQS